jgi:hypothetical protein
MVVYIWLEAVYIKVIPDQTSFSSVGISLASFRNMITGICIFVEFAIDGMLCDMFLQLDIKLRWWKICVPHFMVFTLKGFILHSTKAALKGSGGCDRQLLVLAGYSSCGLFGLSRSRRD